MAGSYASREARLSISDQKLQRYRPWWYGWRAILTAISHFIGPPLSGTRKRIGHYLQIGDASAAILLELDPPLVAVYSEDLDAVALLTFPPGSTDVSGMKSGQKLVAVNTYRGRGQAAESDLLPGPRSSGAWSDFDPLIGDFLSEDRDRLNILRGLIPDYKRRNPSKARDGRPGYGGLRSIRGPND